MKKFYCVSYTIDYHHRVVVGCQAHSEEEAIHQARSAFENGEIWEDTDAMPLLYDDYEEVDGETLQFTAEEVTEFPKPDSSVLELKRRTQAFAACRALLAGYTDLALTLAGQAQYQLPDDWQNPPLVNNGIGRSTEQRLNGSDTGIG